MSAVPRDFRLVVEHFCCENLPLSRLNKGRKFEGNQSMLQVALDLVANKLRY